VKTDKATPVIRFDHQEDNRGDKRRPTCPLCCRRARLPWLEPVELPELRSGRMLDKRWNHLVSERHIRYKMP
jgi:hypothetical protein